MRVNQLARFQRLADRANSAVHHVAGRDNVDTGLGLHQRLADQQFNRLVIEDVAGLFVRQAVLAVAGERVQRDIGHDAEIRKALFELAHHPRHQAVRVQRFLAVVGFQRGINHRKQSHHRNAERHTLFGHRQQQIQAQALDPGIETTASRRWLPSVTNTG